jgi:hypothetical protein
MEPYQNQIKTIIDLQNRGYDHDFILSQESIFCIQKNECMFPDEFDVIAVYRFGNDTLLTGERIIFAISSSNCDLRGILMTSDDNYSSGISIHLWSKLARHMA